MGGGLRGGGWGDFQKVGHNEMRQAWGLSGFKHVKMRRAADSNFQHDKALSLSLRIALAGVGRASKKGARN